jgi:hypothetical protein
VARPRGGSNFEDPNAATARGSLAQAGERYLHRHESRKETGDLTMCRLRSELRARLTKDLAGDRSRRKDCLRWSPPMCALCSMSASESLCRSTTMHSD